MSTSPGPTASRTSSGLPPTPPLGTARPAPAAPRGRRRDHLLAAAVGVVLAPAVVALGAQAEAAVPAAGTPHPVRALVWLAVALVALVAAQTLFARRSSVGNLAAGLNGFAVAAWCGWGLAAHGGHPTDLTVTGADLAVAALLLGGGWGMRRARRAGRAEARIAARLTREDREIGVTPVAPPSRRSDHLLTLVACLTMTGVAARLLPAEYRLLATDAATDTTLLLVGVATALLVAVTAFAGLSTLGARASGVVGVLLALPALLGEHVPGHALLGTVLPGGPGPATVLLVSLVLLTVGGGAHLARSRGRAAERQERRAAEA